MSSFRDQVTFSGENKCAEFEPNRLKPDMCINCYHKLLTHTSEAVKEDLQIKAAMEYSDAGKPSLIFTLDNGHSLFLGGFKSVLNTPFLERNNVRGIVNTAANLSMFGPKWNEGVSRAKEKGVEFLELNWVDSVKQVVDPQVLAEAVKFIHTRLEKCSVLVNCAQGKSRSATVVVAYMMLLNGESYDDSLEGVRKGRMMADPNPNFKKQLLEWQKSDDFRQLREYVSSSS